ncbi:hypothetical protein [Bacillus sp. Bva_UNVM-123]
MTDKEKLSKINFLCLTHIGDKHSLTEEIQKIIAKKKVKKGNK